MRKMHQAEEERLERQETLRRYEEQERERQRQEEEEERRRKEERENNIDLGLMLLAHLFDDDDNE